MYNCMKSQELHATNFLFHKMYMWSKQNYRNENSEIKDKCAQLKCENRSRSLGKTLPTRQRLAKKDTDERGSELQVSSYTL